MTKQNEEACFLTNSGPNPPGSNRCNCTYYELTHNSFLLLFETTVYCKERITTRIATSYDHRARFLGPPGGLELGGLGACHGLDVGLGGPDGGSSLRPPHSGFSELEAPEAASDPPKTR